MNQAAERVSPDLEQRQGPRGDPAPGHGGLALPGATVLLRHSKEGWKLVSVTDTAAIIGLVSGSFSNGSETISINVGETLVLAADDGAHYAIKIVSVAP